MISFSIITVCYNSSHSIVDTMKSVYSQDYKGIEYIIVDGNSSDNTLSVVKKTIDEFGKDHSTTLISEKDNGIYDAMNKGIALSTSDYCCFLNAGDSFSSSTVISDIVKQMDGHIFGFMYGNVISVGKTYKKLVAAKPMDIIENSLDMPYCHQSLFVNTLFLKKHLFDLTYKNASDYYQSVVLYLSKINYLKIDLPIVFYVLGGKSETASIEYFKEKCLIRESFGFSQPSKQRIKKDLRNLKTRRFFKKILPSFLIEWIRKPK